jgi:hypothetical protein
MQLIVGHISHYSVLLCMKKPISPNWNELFKYAVTEAEKKSLNKMVAVLKNNEGRKEYICRKLGIISINDVRRMIK